MRLQYNFTLGIVKIRRGIRSLVKKSDICIYIYIYIKPGSRGQIIKAGYTYTAVRINRRPPPPTSVSSSLRVSFDQ